MAPLGVWPSSQLDRCACGRAGWRLSGEVAVLGCCTLLASSAHALGAALASQTFRLGLYPWLCLVTGWPLLKRPHVAVGVTEIGVEDAAHVLDVAQFDAPLRQGTQVASMSSTTTRWRPLTEPGTMSLIGPIPVPKTTAQLDPGGVS